MLGKKNLGGLENEAPYAPSSSAAGAKIERAVGAEGERCGFC